MPLPPAVTAAGAAACCSYCCPPCLFVTTPMLVQTPWYPSIPPVLLSHLLTLIHTTSVLIQIPWYPFIPPALPHPHSHLALPPTFIRTPLPSFAFPVVAVDATVVPPPTIHRSP